MSETPRVWRLMFIVFVMTILIGMIFLFGCAALGIWQDSVY